MLQKKNWKKSKIYLIFETKISKNRLVLFFTSTLSNRFLDIFSTNYSGDYNRRYVVYVYIT